MATRAIKKATKNDDDLNKLAEKLNKIENSETNESDLDEKPIAPINKFNLLDELDNEENGSDNDEENELSKNEEAQAENDKGKNKKKSSKSKSKKNNSKTKLKYVSSPVDENDFDEDVLLSKLMNKNFAENEKIRQLFQIESKNLNADNEMIRMFGAKIVQAERENLRGRRPVLNRFKHNSIVNLKPRWPEYRRLGLSMRILNENEADNSMEYTFEHSKDYQKVQFAFLDAVESLDHNNIIAVLRLNTYHIDSLIQLSDTSRIHDDTQMAADLIERALYAYQNSFHPSFTFSLKNGSLRLDYNRVENRGFFIALFKHILYVGGKACYRTSLELCKLLFSLDLQGDPLAVILIIDFYAIRSSQYEYFIELYELFNKTKHLDLMPNMSMSLALAYFYLYKKTNNQEDLNKADKKLQECLIRFPAILMDLLDKCNVIPDKQVETHWIFAKTSHLKIPVGLKYLLDLYVNRMFYEWKIPENLQWLERNVKEVISKEKSLQSSINEFKKKAQSLFSKVPPNVYRHLMLSDVKEVSFRLPPEYSSSASYTFDPVPPKNSIVSYARPPRTSSSEPTAYTRAETFFNFFQSLMPSFNPQNAAAANRRAENAAQEGNEPAAVGADVEGAAAAAPNEFRIDMNQILGRLRDFFENIEINFPAAQGNDNNNDLNAENENNEDRDNHDDDDDVHDINEYD